MKRKIPERYLWAVETLNVQPDDQILEFGCGYGHSISLICPKLTTGLLTLVDRSDKMIRAVRSSYAGLEEQRYELHHGDLLNLQLNPNSFEKIFIFNINAFWMDPCEELREVKRLLARAGQFYIFHQPPPGHSLEEFIVAFGRNLVRYGFDVRADLKNEEEKVRSLCMISRPTSRR